MSMVWRSVHSSRKNSLTSKRRCPSPLEYVIPLKLNNAAQLTFSDLVFGHG